MPSGPMAHFANYPSTAPTPPQRSAAARPIVRALPPGSASLSLGQTHNSGSLKRPLSLPAADCAPEVGLDGSLPPPAVLPPAAPPAQVRSSRSADGAFVRCAVPAAVVSERIASPPQESVTLVLPASRMAGAVLFHAVAPVKFGKRYILANHPEFPTL